MPIYRTIYIKHYGSIPKDDSGRTYDIHHIDGNKHNNSIENLIAVSKKEHYDIHYAQKDWGACMLIAESLKISPEEKSFLAKENHKNRIKNGTHPFLGGAVAKEMNRKRIEDGTHNFLGGKIQRALARRRVKEGTHHWLSGELQRVSTNRRLQEGTHPFQVDWTCPVCGTKGKNKAMYNRWHGTKCKNGKNEPEIR